MSLDLFRVALGIELTSDDQTLSAAVLLGTGTPGADAAEQDAAGIGTLYLRTDAETNNLQLYYKYANTGNDATDWNQPTSSAFVTGLTSGLQTEIDAIETSVGLQTDGTLGTPFLGLTYLSGATDILNALTLIDNQETSIQTEVDNIETAIGAGIDAAGVFAAGGFSTGNFINDATSFTDALLQLDTQSQVLVDGKVNKAGDTMDSGANLVFVGGGEILGLPATPSTSTAAASKAYVDSLSGGLSWINPVWYVDLISDALGNALSTTTLVRDLQTPVNDSSEVALAEESDMYIIGASAVAITLAAVGVTGNTTSIGPFGPGQVVRFIADETNGFLNPTWEDKGHLSTYPDIVNTGDTDKARWGIATVSSAEAEGTFATKDGYVMVLSDRGTLGNYNPVWLDATEMTAPGPIESQTFIVNNPDSKNAYKQFSFIGTYNNAAYPGTDTNEWIVIGATAGVVDGVGLTYSGNILNVNLGAGIVELPSDEVGVDVRSTGGLITTIDGTTTDVTGPAQLAIKLDGTSLTLSANGIRVDAGILTEIDNIEAASGLDTSGNFVAYTGTNYVDTATTLANAITLVDTQVGTNTTNIGTNTTNISNLGIEVDAIETSLGPVVLADGTYNGSVAFVGSTYLTTSTDITDALLDLDTQLLAVAGSTGDEVNIRDFIGKSATGVELPLYSSTDVVTDGTSLEAAIGDLDAIVGTMTFVTPNVLVSYAAPGTNDISANLVNLDTAIGSRLYTNTLNHALDIDSETLSASLEKLNLAVGGRDYTNTGNHALNTDGDTISASLEKLNIATGDRVYTADNVVVDGQTVTASIDALDQAVGNITGVIKIATPGSVSTVVDSVAIVDAEIVKWLVSGEDAVDATKRISYEVHAITDGTNADYTNYARLKTNGGIAGFKIDVTVNLGNIELSVNSNAACDVAVKRIAAYTFN